MCGLNKDISIDEIPELIIIKDHLSEYYPDEAIHVFPYKNTDGKVYANFYINLRCVVSTAVIGSAWVRKVRHKKELENKLTLIGIKVNG